MYQILVIAIFMIRFYFRLQNDQKYQMEKLWKQFIEKNKLDGYFLNGVQEEKYGFKLIINLKLLEYSKLKSKLEAMESTYECKIEIERSQDFKSAIIHLYKNHLTDENHQFTPIKVKPYEIYVAHNSKHLPIISNLNKFPHVLVSGQTGSGKSECIRSILTNSIANTTSRHLHIYFSDLSDTCDFEIFSRCDQTQAYARNIEQSLKLFSHIDHVHKKRLELFKKHNLKNIREYNSRFRRKQMQYIFVVCDEFADYFPANKYDEHYKEKVLCYNLLRHHIRKSRKSGVFFILGIQRPDTTVLDPSLRSGLCTKIGLSQNTDSSSLVVCDTKELTDLGERKGLFMAGCTREWFKTVYITDMLINQYVEDNIVDKNIDSFFKEKEEVPPSIKSSKTIPISNKNTKKKTKSRAKIS